MKEKNKYLNDWKDYLLRKEFERFLTQSYRNFHPGYSCKIKTRFMTNGIIEIEINHA